MTGPVQFTALGPLAATRGGLPIDLGPRRQCALLALLLCRSNRIVRADALLDGVWGDDQPASGQRLIATYVYRLRRLLAEDPAIERALGGYRLSLDDTRLDTVRFTTGLDEAREQRANGRLTAARARLTEALRLWRGEPFSGLPGPSLDAERTRLTALRLDALEQRAELDLRCGTDDLGAGELASLRARHPLRERLTTLLMIALYRAGRQAEALAVFRETDTRLRGELGVEPGRELADVHGAVLRGDENALGGLGWPAPAADRVLLRRRDDLPPAPPAFTGRAAELAVLTESPPGVVAVDGAPGVGKTALLRHAAGMLSDQHPGGRFHLDLRGHRAGAVPLHPADALRRLLVAAGHSATALPADLDDRAALWRDTIAEDRVLLVLDDAECADQVLPLLPGNPDSTVLVAGRPRLPALPADAVLSLVPLDVEQGRALVTGLLDADRTADSTALRELVLRCGGSPLLLVRAAGRLRHRPALRIADLVSSIAGPGGLLELVRAEGRGADELLLPSWERLRDGERRALAAGTHRVADGPVLALLAANLLAETAPGVFAPPPLVADFVAASSETYSQVNAGSLAE